jgi:hypothetical protein
MGTAFDADGDENYEPPIKQTRAPLSPPSVSLHIPTTSKSHAYCFVCKKPGPKIIVVSDKLRLNVYVRKGIIVPAGARCCPAHIKDEQFSEEALGKITPFSEEVTLSRTSIRLLLETSRNLLLEKYKIRIDFDHPDALTDDDYITLTGVSKTEFEDLMLYIDEGDLRNTSSRSTRMCVAILLTKLRCGLSNKLLATLFGMKKHQVYLKYTKMLNILINKMHISLVDSSFNIL